MKNNKTLDFLQKKLWLDCCIDNWCKYNNNFRIKIHKIYLLYFLLLLLWNFI